MNKTKHRFSTVCTLALIALAAACTTQPRVPAGDAAGLEQRAQQEQEQGNLRVAAQLYRQLADTVSGTERAAWLIEASRLAVARDDTAAAAEWLTEAEAAADRRQRQSIEVLRADMELRAGRAANALSHLNQLGDGVPVPVMVERDAVRGRALFELQRYGEAVETLVRRETWLDTSEQIIENQRMIWNGLADIDPQAAPVGTGDAVVDGWLALAPIAAADSSSGEMRRSLLDWRRGHPNHPAAGGLLADLLGEVRVVDAFPQQIALLLPISSPQRPQAIAIRDGFMAAHFVAGNADADANADDTTIRVYDTALLGGADAYMQARLEGADFIVGPLLSQDVEAVVPQAGLVPTLALNFARAETSFTRGFYQFALAPEHETRAIARRAIASGAETAVALVSSDTWGYRLLDSFREEFEALGGEFLGFNGYEPSAQDFSGPIESLLNLDRSEQRRTRLAANLGVGVAFVPRRRQDVDMIFLGGADFRTGRLLAPALQFHFAGDIPTYAMSDIHEPSSQGRENDLNDIFFPDAPLLLSPDANNAEIRESLEAFWPQRAAENLRFYGMGLDAYALVGALFSGATNWPIEGVSGLLELDADGRVNRVLPFAQYRNGRPVALEPLPAPERNRFEAIETEEFAGFR